MGNFYVIYLMGRLLWPFQSMGIPSPKPTLIGIGFREGVPIFRNGQSNPEWEFIGVFADEGITGTSTKSREGFKKMIQTALSGGIDLILTKSISRFARNTVDTLQTVRQLKSVGVEVIFEKENLHTMDGRKVHFHQRSL